MNFLYNSINKIEKNLKIYLKRVNIIINSNNLYLKIILIKYKNLMIYEICELLININNINEIYNNYEIILIKMSNY